MTWYKTSREFFNFFNRSQKMRQINENWLKESETDYDLLTDGFEDHEPSNITEEFKNRQMTIVPSYSTKTELKGLETNQIYLIEVNFFIIILILIKGLLRF